ncbi:hypothetical protein ES705_15974 [subsurface metagenome]
MNPIDLNRLMWLALGAGSKGVIGGMVSGFVPGAGITPDIATAFVGFFIAQQGGQRVGTFGEGMLIASIGQIVRQPMEDIFSKFGGNQSGGGGGTTQTTTKLTEKSAQAGSSTEQYLTSKYGVKVG